MQALHQPDMLDARPNINDDADYQERRTQPHREPSCTRVNTLMRDAEFSEEETEPGDYETEAHQSNAGSNPSKKSPLRR